MIFITGNLYSSGEINEKGIVNPNTNLDTNNELIEELGDKYTNLDPLIENFMESGTFPDTIQDDRIIVVSHNQLDYLNDAIIPPIKIQGTYLYFTNAKDSLNLRRIYLDPNVKQIVPDYKFDFESQSNPDSNVSPSSFIAEDILNTEKVWQEFGYTGNDVTIGVIDSGVDFGVSDLSGAAKLLSSGISASFDATGAGLGFSNTTVQSFTNSRGEFLPLSSVNITIWLGEQFTIDRSDQMGLRLSDLEITGIGNPSLSGNYKVGIMYQPGFQETIPTQYFIFVLTDSTVSGVYDTLYVDLDTSLAISLSRGGIILESGNTYLSLADWSLVDEIPYGNSNPLIARDIDEDGINDVSMGILATTLDIYSVVNTNPTSEGLNVRGIDSKGRGFSVLYDPVGHGTLVASASSGRGNSQITLFDVKTTSEIENGTSYQLFGSAPNSSIVVSKALTLQEFVIGWYWTAGLEVIIDPFGNIIWDVTDNSIEHRVEISSNSWGSGIIAEDDSLKGQDLYSLLLDLFSAPDLLYIGYPGTIFVVASGNAGPGYGTVGKPGTASMAITVGASSSYHFKDNVGKNDVAWFSNRGPTPYGTIKPDLVALGNTGYTHYPLITGLGNGSRAGGTFGGTSEATPRVSGSIALVIEAMKANGILPTLSNVRTLIKGTAEDLGFPAAAQGAGLVNPYAAISAIIDGDKPLLRTNVTTKLIGNRLQAAFGNLFVDNVGNPLTHPLVSGEYYDTFIVITPDLLKNEVFIETVYANGSIASTANYSKSIEFLKETSNTSFNLSSANSLTTTINLGDIWDFPSNWRENEYLQISLALNNDSYIALSDAGLQIPDLILSDSTTGKIVYDLLSFNTWTQQLYAGNLSDDFTGSPVIEFQDPGIIDEVPLWSGLFYDGYATTYDYFEMNEIAVSSKATGITFKSTTIENEFRFASMLFADTLTGDTQRYPILISAEEEVKYGQFADIVGNDIKETIPYDLDTYFGSFDWGFRPDSGEFRYFRLKVPENATFLAISATWEVDGFIPDMYLFNDFGELVTKSDVEYIGGGFYTSSVSEPLTQNLLTRVDSTIYTLLVHVVHMPYSASPIQLSVLTRYLTIEQLPNPSPKYSQELSSNISGELAIDTSDYKIDEFPELQIKSTSAKIYQGQNDSFAASMSVNFLIPGPGTSLAMIEAIHFLEFEKGEKVKLKLNWSGNLDLDMFVFPVDQQFDLKSDLLAQQGSSVGNSTENAFLSIPETGTYAIYIDFVFGELSSNIIPYQVTWESRDGPTISQESDILSFNTGVFPNGNYGMFVTFETNFGISFSISEQIKTLNHFNFTSELLSPNEGSVNSKVNIIWEASTTVYANIILQIGSSEILLATGVSSNNYEFDTRLYSNGPAILHVILSDYVYSHSHFVTININNENPVTLPPEVKSTNRSVNYPLPIFIIMSMLVMTISRRAKNK
ncbi:MAG: S8 family serine peptidase [Candidatus Heimdallarchaeota archaeon]|nr:S8 family serine peptidase [Candidatus Heimdallarchaeota archaeon]